ncbi:3-oxoacyl-ACP synthase [Streptomyces albireticuli]|uniref:3-oxoacyl-ACP synthase n=1 Tax=Streptomyces albireticuli TaxID=1940 RepID=A0A1Z2LE97_9ACTN|nr:3-oxoacyl-ACP synthase [Streptomyces albireticuli]
MEAVVLATTTRTGRARPPRRRSPPGSGWAGAAFDIAAVCTGFLYGLATAAGLIASGGAGGCC